MAKALSRSYLLATCLVGRCITVCGMSESRVRATPSVGVAHLLLMHPKAQVLLPGDDTPIGLRGTPARVLRLLALSRGHWFSTDWLAEACNYTSSKSVAARLIAWAMAWRTSLKASFGCIKRLLNRTNSLRTRSDPWCMRADLSYSTEGGPCTMKLVPTTKT